MNPNPNPLRSLFETIANTNNNPNQAGIDALRRLASSSLGGQADDAVAEFLATTVNGTRTGGSASANKLLELADAELVAVVRYRLGQHAAQAHRAARRRARQLEQAPHVAAEPVDIETEVRRRHDAGRLAADLRRSLGEDLVRLIRARLRGTGLADLAAREGVATSTIHGRLALAIERLKSHSRLTGSSRETGALVAALLAA